VINAHEQDGCGSNVTGYMVIAQGLLWADSWRGNAGNTTDCMARCDSSRDCIGFTARTPRKGKMQCDLYKGLQKQKDHRGVSYSKCLKALKCADGEGFLGFEFSHNGSWKHGLKMAVSSLGACSKDCRHDRACVGFTHRTTRDGAKECWHYLNAANKQGPRRDMRAYTYSKCSPASSSPTQGTAGEGEALAAAGGAPSSPSA